MDCSFQFATKVCFYSSFSGILLSHCALLCNMFNHAAVEMALLSGTSMDFRDFVVLSRTISNLNLLF